MAKLVSGSITIAGSSTQVKGYGLNDIPGGTVDKASINAAQKFEYDQDEGAAWHDEIELTVSDSTELIDLSLGVTDPYSGSEAFGSINAIIITTDSPLNVIFLDQTWTVPIGTMALLASEEAGYSVGSGEYVAITADDFADDGTATVEVLILGKVEEESSSPAA